ncbi:MAG: OstA-like protein [Chitinophagaceae bacterium]
MYIKRALSCCFLLLLLGNFALAQQTDTIKTGKLIIVEGAERYNFQQINDSTQLVSLAGKAFVRQGKASFYADSIVLNQKNNLLEAFGNVHINDADSVHTYANYLKYLGKERKAFLNGNVKLTDGKGVLTTQELTYDVATKMGTYYKGGKLVNGKSVLTSEEGYYYGETRDVYFKKKVVLVNPDGKLTTDTLLYNNSTQIASFVAPTNIINGKRTIKTKDGFYDMRLKKAQLGKRPFINDSTYTFTADEAVIDDSTGLSQYRGNAVYRSKDSVNGYDLIANDIKVNKKKNAVLATEKPLLLIKQKKDTTFITADTLFAGKISELKKLKTIPDVRNTEPKDSSLTIQKSAIKDTTNDQFFEAYHHVKIFADSLQAVCDSLFYSLEDSTFRLFKDPVVWTQSNQITGDTIFLFLENKQPEKLSVFENAMMLQKLTDNYFNQIKSNTINAFFKKGKIDFLKAKGNAETVYYGQDDYNKFAAVNKSTCDVIDLFFERKSEETRPQKIVMRNNLKGTAFPMGQVNHLEIRLRKFKWQENIRPKSRFDILAN